MIPPEQIREVVQDDPIVDLGKVEELPVPTELPSSPIFVLSPEDHFDSLQELFDDPAPKNAKLQSLL